MNIKYNSYSLGVNDDYADVCFAVLSFEVKKFLIKR
jgi:hypothetical protein